VICPEPKPYHPGRGKYYSIDYLFRHNAIGVDWLFTTHLAGWVAWLFSVHPIRILNVWFFRFCAWFCCWFKRGFSCVSYTTHNSCFVSRPSYIKLSNCVFSALHYIFVILNVNWQMSFGWIDYSEKTQKLIALSCPDVARPIYFNLPFLSLSDVASLLLINFTLPS
jgi:hypothetical protein